MIEKFRCSHTFHNHSKFLGNGLPQRLRSLGVGSIVFFVSIRHKQNTDPRTFRFLPLFSMLFLISCNTVMNTRTQRLIDPCLKLTYWCELSFAECVKISSTNLFLFWCWCLCQGRKCLGESMMPFFTEVMYNRWLSTLSALEGLQVVAFRKRNFSSSTVIPETKCTSTSVFMAKKTELCTCINFPNFLLCVWLLKKYTNRDRIFKNSRPWIIPIQFRNIFHEDN